MRKLSDYLLNRDRLMYFNSIAITINDYDRVIEWDWDLTPTGLKLSDYLRNFSNLEVFHAIMSMFGDLP